MANVAEPMDDGGAALPRLEAVGYRPPPRPRTEADLKFSPQPRVQWFDPRVLAKSGARVVLSGALGEFLDKRELQAGLDEEPPDHLRDQADVWFDFVADMGDGFDATYSVAWLASLPELSLASGERLPRGRVLVLGGDEVYPVANADAYEQRFKGPYEASLPWLDHDNPDIYAIPGNHDWYDGLTSFVRLFCQEKWVGGRRTRQRRSYFALALPNRWWLWGIDIQLDSYIDEPQLNYFRRVDLRPGDRVMLCTATPAWVEGSDSRGFKNLAYLERTLIRPRGARLVLSLSGDSHHYLHYVGDDGTHKVTAGGGGAFLHPTHIGAQEPLAIDIGSDDSTPQTFEETCAYPDRRTSRRLTWGALALPWRNRLFAAVPGVVYLLQALSSQFSQRAFQRTGPLEEAAPDFGWIDLLRGLVSNPVSVLVLLVFLGALSGFAKPSPRRLSAHRRRLAVKWLMALAHLALHVLAVTLVGLLAVAVASAAFDGNGVGFTTVLVLIMAVVGGVAGSLVTGFYLAVCCALFNAHGNEAFSAMGITGYKSFLRIHLDREGVVHVYPLGIRRPATRWRLDPDAPAGAPWLAPDGPPPAAHLIEPPFTVA